MSCVRQYYISLFYVIEWGILLSLGASLSAAVSDPCGGAYGVDPCEDHMTCEVLDTGGSKSTVCVGPCYKVDDNGPYYVCDETSQECYMDNTYDSVCR